MKISVIIPTYNSRRMIKNCLDAVLAQRAADAEVIVVDNGSTDGSADLVSRDYPGVRLIRNDKNEGAARARNQGIVQARGQWIMTLDSDVVVGRDFFKAIAECLQGAESRTGILQAKIYVSDQRTIFSTGVQLSILRRFYDRGSGQKDLGQFDRRRRIFGACSAAAVYRRTMLDEMKDRHGYFDERFFFLVEDVDLAWRAGRAGWKTVFCPAAVCYHRGNGSGTDRALRQYLSFRNRKLMMEKNEGLLGRCRAFLLTPFYDLPRRLYMARVNRYFRSPPHL